MGRLVTDAAGCATHEVFFVDNFCSWPLSAISLLRRIVQGFRSRTTATVQGFYVPKAKSGINSTLCKALKKCAARYYQLRIGHGAIGTLLARIGVIETPERWWCGAQEQTVIHLYTKCRRWRRERRKLSRELSQHGISWQPRSERRWLGSL